MPELPIKTVVAWKLDDLIVPFDKSIPNWQALLRAHLEGTSRQLVCQGRLLVKPTDEELVELLQAGALKFYGKRVKVDAACVVNSQLLYDDPIDPGLHYTNDARAFVQRYKASFYAWHGSSTPLQGRVGEASRGDAAVFHVRNSATSYILNADDFFATRQEDLFFFAPLGSIFNFFQMFIAWSNDLGNVVHSLTLPLDGSVQPEKLRQLLDTFCSILTHVGIAQAQIPRAFTSKFWLDEQHLTKYQMECQSAYEDREGVALKQQKIPLYFSEAISLLATGQRCKEDTWVQVEQNLQPLSRANIVKEVKRRIHREESPGKRNQRIFVELMQTKMDKIFYAQKFNEQYGQAEYFLQIIISAHEEWSLKTSTCHIMHKAFDFQIDPSSQLALLISQLFALIAQLKEVNILDFCGYCLSADITKPGKSIASNMLMIGSEQEWLQAFQNIFQDRLLGVHNEQLRLVVNDPNVSLNAQQFVPYEESIIVHMATLSAILTMMLGDPEKNYANFIQTLPEDFLLLLPRALNGGRQNVQQNTVVQKKIAGRFILLWIYTVLRTASTKGYPKAFADCLLRSVFNGGFQYQHIMAGNAYLLDELSAQLIARLLAIPKEEIVAASDEAVEEFVPRTLPSALSSKMFAPWFAVYPMVGALLAKENGNADADDIDQAIYALPQGADVSAAVEQRIRCVHEPFNQPNQLTKIVMRDKGKDLIEVVAVLRLTFVPGNDLTNGELHAAAIQESKTWHLSADGVYAYNATPSFNRAIFSIRLMNNNRIQLTWHGKGRQFYFDTTGQSVATLNVGHPSYIRFKQVNNPQNLLSLEIANQLVLLQNEMEHIIANASQLLWLLVYLKHIQLDAHEHWLVAQEPRDNLLSVIAKFLKIQLQPLTDETDASLKKWLNRYSNNLSKHCWALVSGCIIFSAIAAIVACYLIPAVFSYDSFDIDLFAQSEKNLKIARLIVIILTVFPYALYAAALQVILFIGINMNRARQLGAAMLEDKSLYEVALAAAGSGTLGRTDQLSNALQASLQITENDDRVFARQPVQKTQRLLANVIDCARNGGVLPEMQAVLLQTNSNQQFLARIREKSVTLIRDYTQTTRVEYHQDTHETKMNIAIIVLAMAAIATPPVLNHFFQKSLEDAKVKEYLGGFLMGELLSGASMAGVSASMLLIGLIASMMYLIDYLVNKVHYPKLSRCWQSCLTLLGRRGGYEMLQEEDVNAQELIRGPYQ